MELGGATSELIKLALDIAELQHRVGADNIANANSAGFRPYRTDFSGMLDSLATQWSGNDDGNKQLAESMRRNLDERAVVMTGSDLVQLDQELARIAQSTLHYQALLTAMGKRGSTIQLAITEGK